MQISSKSFELGILLDVSNIEKVNIIERYNKVIFSFAGGLRHAQEIGALVHKSKDLTGDFLNSLTAG